MYNKGKLFWPWSTVALWPVFQEKSISHGQDQEEFRFWLYASSYEK